MGKKAFREIIRMAETEGVTSVWIDKGKPHDRLCGTFAGEPFEVVISTTDFNARYSPEMTRGNIRREIKRLRDTALERAARRLLTEKASADAP